jgi:hypothetical protein
MLSDILNINLSKELGLDEMPEQTRDDLIKQMNETLDSRVSIALMSRLSDTDKQELNKLLDADKDVTSFLKERLPDFDVIVAEIVANFKSEMLELEMMVREHSSSA